MTILGNFALFLCVLWAASGAIGGVAFEAISRPYTQGEQWFRVGLGVTVAVVVVTFVWGLMPSKSEGE